MSKNLLSRLSDNEAIKEMVCKLLKECKPGYNDFRVDRSIKIRINEKPITIHSAGDLLVKNADGLNLLYIKIAVWDTPSPDDDKKQALAYARSLSEGNIPPFTILMDEEKTRMYDTFTGDQMENNSITIQHPYIQNGFECSVDIPELQEEALTYFESLTPENLFSFCNEQFESKSQLFHSHSDTRPCDDTEMGEIDKILREVGQDPLSLNWVYTYVENIIALQIDEKQFIEELAELILSGVSTEDNKEGREKAEFWIKLLLKIDEEFDTSTFF
ncbi:MAG: hypothetical protein LUF85_09955 [Bacteroides sp.]|nr:hypothetical protein [Bacteroides sp.]